MNKKSSKYKKISLLKWAERVYTGSQPSLDEYELIGEIHVDELQEYDDYAHDLGVVEFSLGLLNILDRDFVQAEPRCAFMLAIELKERAKRKRFSAKTLSQLEKQLAYSPPSLYAFDANRFSHSSFMGDDAVKEVGMGIGDGYRCFVAEYDFDSRHLTPIIWIANIKYFE